MITQEQMDRLRELEKAATPGPWRYELDDVYFCKCLCIGDSSFDIDANDGEFIAESRNALPALLDEIERLREREAKMKRALQFYAEQMHFDCYEDLDGQTEIDLVDDGLCARTTLAELYPEG